MLPSSRKNVQEIITRRLEPITIIDRQSGECGRRNEARYLASKDGKCKVETKHVNKGTKHGKQETDPRREERKPLRGGKKERKPPPGDESRLARREGWRQNEI